MPVPLSSILCLGFTGAALSQYLQELISSGLIPRLANVSHLYELDEVIDGLTIVTVANLTIVPADFQAGEAPEKYTSGPRPDLSSRSGLHATTRVAGKGAESAERIRRGDRMGAGAERENHAERGVGYASWRMHAPRAPVIARFHVYAIRALSYGEPAVLRRDAVLAQLGAIRLYLPEYMNYCLLSLIHI